MSNAVNPVESEGVSNAVNPVESGSSVSEVAGIEVTDPVPGTVPDARAPDLPAGEVAVDRTGKPGRPAGSRDKRKRKRRGGKNEAVAALVEASSSTEAGTETPSAAPAVTPAVTPKAKKVESGPKGVFVRRRG